MTENERLPPCDKQAEQSVLGAMLMSPDAVRDVTDVLAGGEFYVPVHQEVYDAILAVNHRGVRPDGITVAAELESRGSLAMVGGVPYLHTLMETVPTAVNADHYAEIVAAKAVLRRLGEAAQRVAQLAQSGANGADVDEVLERARATVDDATASYRHRQHDEGIDVGDLAFATLDRYAQPRPPGLPTGWFDLDGVLGGGLRPGQLMVVAARPGVGKSLIGLNLAVEASRNGTGTVFASLEMHRDEVMDRIYAQLAHVELDHLTRHALSQDDWQRVQDVAQDLVDVPLRIEDTPHLSMAKLRSLSRDRTRHPSGLGLVVADYVQLIRPADSRISREQQVAAISRELKLMAKELNAPVVALAQLNRAVEARTVKRPVIADLRESGAIEQDSDIVLLLWDDPERQGERQVVVGKNRQGRTADISLSWAPHYAQARSLQVVKDAA